MKNRTIFPEYVQDFLKERGRKVSVKQTMLIVGFMYQLADAAVKLVISSAGLSKGKLIIYWRLVPRTDPVGTNVEPVIGRF